MKQKQPIARERRKTGRKLLAAVLSLAMILTLANPTTVFAAEESGTEESGGFWSNAIESIADFFGFGGDDAADAGAQARAATTGDGVQRTADTDTTQEYTLGMKTLPSTMGVCGWTSRSALRIKSPLAAMLLPTFPTFW